MIGLESVRREVLVSLVQLYPAPFRRDQIVRVLAELFPDIDSGSVGKDLAYLCERGLVARVVATSEGDGAFTASGQRWYRATADGVDAAHAEGWAS